MGFSMNNKLSVIDNFQFLSSSLDSFVKKSNKAHFKYLSQEFDNNVLDQVRVELSHSKKNCVIFLIESTLKMMKSAFYFILKALFVLKKLNFLS